MKRLQRGTKPDTTDSSTVGNSQNTLGRAETEVTKSGSGRATASRPPTAHLTPLPEREIDDEEYILKREPDERYRMVGHRPTKRAQLGQFANSRGEMRCQKRSKALTQLSQP